MTKKIGMTRQGVRDLNHYGPQRPKDALDDRIENRRRRNFSIGTGVKCATR